jgi:hypothetical protein
MNETEAAVREQLQEIVRNLEENRERLSGIAEGLPLSPLERPELRDVDLAGDPDFTSEVRRVIQCILIDNLEPAIRDLRSVAGKNAAPAAGDPAAGL